MINSDIFHPRCIPTTFQPGQLTLFMYVIVRTPPVQSFRVLYTDAGAQLSSSCTPRALQQPCPLTIPVS